MKIFLTSLVALVMLSSRAYAEPNPSSSLPSASKRAAVKSHLFGTVDWILAGSVVVGRALDWTSTEECLRRPWCYEVELPTVLVKNKVGFAAFEAVVSGFSILAQYEMTRHGHRRLARLGQSIDVGSIWYSVLHNYTNDRRPGGDGLRPETPKLTCSASVKTGGLPAAIVFAIALFFADSPKQPAGQWGRVERGDQGEDGGRAASPMGEGKGGEVTRPLRRCGHVDQSYLVTLKPPSRALQHEVASIVRVSGDRLIFVNVKGTLAAPFL